MNDTSLFIKLAFIIGSPFAGYFLYQTYAQRKINEYWKRSDRTPFHDSDIKTLKEKFHPYSYLNESEQKELQRKIKFFLMTKNINPVGEIIVTPEMKLLIAAEACLLITNLPLNVFPGLTNIYLMEDTFIKKDNPINPNTGLQVDVPKLGEAWKGGPIVLSWTAVEDGLKHPHGRNNVVFHEFSHNLDQQDGSFDGTPSLGPSGNYQRWSDVMGQEFIGLKKILSLRHSSDIDAYGATNEAEFFAVLTEYFFNRPKMLREKHPDIYDIYNQYFKIDPIRWDV
jgi:Mlc titration factor MtfA (ptsG expression regulator)